VELNQVKTPNLSHESQIISLPNFYFRGYSKRNWYESGRWRNWTTQRRALMI